MFMEYEFIDSHGTKRTVRLTGQSPRALSKNPLFLNWLKNFDHENMELGEVNFQSADFVGNGDRAIFVKDKSDVRNRKTGDPLPGITFRRGNSISIFTLIESEETGEKYILITKQPRIPLGIYEYEEIPAGMLDDDTLLSRAIRELEEETGIRVSAKDLTKLGIYAPSSGGCDEYIVVFYTKVKLPEEKITELLSKTHGCVYENEFITLTSYRVEEFVEKAANNEFTDGKIFTSIAFILLKQSKQAVVDAINSL